MTYVSGPKIAVDCRPVVVNTVLFERLAQGLEELVKRGTPTHGDVIDLIQCLIVVTVVPNQLP